MIGLADRAGDQTKNYSGGMKRRLNIGIGLLHRPKLLILDEPTVGVDPQSRNAILDSVERCRRGHGGAVHHALHGGGRAPVRPGRDHRPRQADRRGHAPELVSLVGERDRVRLSAAGELATAAVAPGAPPWVHKASATGEGIDLVVDDARADLPPSCRAAAAGAAVKSVEVTEPDLEAVFLHLTGRALRD